jgi:hypothetical protein
MSCKLRRKTMKIYDLLWKRTENRGKTRWEKVGVLIDKEDKKSIKLDLLPVSADWDGWLVVSERRDKAELFSDRGGFASGEKGDNDEMPDPF